MSLIILTVHTVLRPEHGAVMVDSQRADYQFVIAVIIHISGGHIMIALSGITVAVRYVKVPCQCQMTAYELVSRYRSLRIITSVQQYRGHCLAAAACLRLICHGNIEAGCTIAPVIIIIFKICHRIYIVYGVNLFTGSAVENTDIFITCHIRMSGRSDI